MKARRLRGRLSHSFPVRNYGDKLSIDGSLKTPKNFVEDFDYVAYLKKQNIRTTVPFPKINEKEDLQLGFFEKVKDVFV